MGVSLRALAKGCVEAQMHRRDAPATKTSQTLRMTIALEPRACSRSVVPHRDQGRGAKRKTHPLHHSNTTNETPCRGRFIFTSDPGTDSAGRIASSSDAFIKSPYCCGEGFFGEPIFFHVSNALLCSSSIRNSVTAGLHRRRRLDYQASDQSPPPATNTVFVVIVPDQNAELAIGQTRQRRHIRIAANAFRDQRRQRRRTRAFQPRCGMAIHFREHAEDIRAPGKGTPLVASARNPAK